MGPLSNSGRGSWAPGARPKMTVELRPVTAQGHSGQRSGPSIPLSQD